jgi:hypothetical protein
MLPRRIDRGHTFLSAITHSRTISLRSGGIGYGQAMHPLVLFVADFGAALGVSFVLVRVAELCSRLWGGDDPPDDGGWRRRPHPRTPPDRGLERGAGAPDRGSPKGGRDRGGHRRRVPTRV